MITKDSLGLMMKQRISIKVATIFGAQDLSQIEDLYETDKKNTLLANLNNQFFGRVASYPTAQYVVNLWGKAYVKSETVSENKSSHQASVSKTQRLHERSRVTVQQVLSLETGEFLGQLVESSVSSFKAKIRVQNRGEGVPLPAFRRVDATLIRENFTQIRAEVKNLLSKGQNLANPARLDPVRLDPVWRDPVWIDPVRLDPTQAPTDVKPADSSESEDLDF